MTGTELSLLELAALTRCALLPFGFGLVFTFISELIPWHICGCLRTTEGVGPVSMWIPGIELLPSDLPGSTMSLSGPKWETVPVGLMSI